MESQIQQFDSSLKQNHSAQQSFANVLEDTWGKGSKCAMRADEVANPNALPNKCGGNLDFSNDIYGDKFGKTKYDQKPKAEEGGLKDDIIRQKKEFALKEEQLIGEKKRNADANGSVIENKKDAEGKSKQPGDESGLTPMPGKEVKDGGEKSKFAGNDQSSDNSGLIPMPGKEIKDGGEKSNELPGKSDQQEVEKGKLMFSPDKQAQKNEMPNIYGTEVPNRKAYFDK